MKSFFGIAIILLCGHLEASGTVFGLHMGAPLSIGQCTRKGTSYDMFAKDPLCWKHFATYGDLSDAPPNGGYVEIDFPPGEDPRIADGSKVRGLVIDGKLEAISLQTGGYSWQDEVLEKLKGKYGEPTIFKPRTLKSAIAGRIKTYTAIWLLESLTVSFGGVSGTIDKGFLSIQTLLGAEFEKEKLDAADDKRRKL